MVSRISQSPKDQFHLNRLYDSDYAQSSQPKDYRNIVVVKPWGYEYLIFENEEVAIWYLSINHNHSTSMHCHSRKKTSLTILDGMAQCITFGKRNELSTAESIIFEKGVFHSTKSISENGIKLLELETPVDKTDLTRLDDSYGRQKSGYEGLSEMQTENLERFEYFFFEEPSGPNGQVVQIGSSKLSISKYDNNSVFIEDFSPVNGAVYKICRGEIKSSNGLALATTGDSIFGSTLQSSEYEIEAPVTILSILSVTE